MILRPSSLALRLCARSLRLSPVSHAAPSRALSTTAPRRASDLPSGMPDRATLERLQRSPMWEKLKASPEALAAAQKFGEVMQKQGINALSGQMPSKFQMARLFLKADVRAAISELHEAFTKAGINLQDPEMMKQLMSSDKEEPKN